MPQAPPTDASRNEQSKPPEVVVVFLVSLVVRLAPAGVAAGSQTAWVGRKPGVRGSGLAAAGPRLVAKPAAPDHGQPMPALGVMRHRAPRAAAVYAAGRRADKPPGV